MNRRDFLTRSGLLVLAFPWLARLTGCGDDDDNTTGTGGSGGSAEAGTGGAGGEGGSGGLMYS